MIEVAAPSVSSAPSVSVSCCSPNMFEGLGRCHGVRQRPGRAWGPRTAPRPRRDGLSVGPNVPLAPAAPLAASAERVFSDSWSLARFFWRASRKKASRTDCCCRHHKRGGDPPLREPNSPALPPLPKSEDFDREWTRPRRGLQSCVQVEQDISIGPARKAEIAHGFIAKAAESLEEQPDCVGEGEGHEQPGPLEEQ